MPHNAHIPFPWRQILSALWVLNYSILAALGTVSLGNWMDRWEAGHPAAVVALWAAAPVAVFGTVCAIAKALGWWQMEWIASWFLMGGLTVQASLIGVLGGTAWAAAGIFFVVACAHRNISLGLFARDARWGAERRHLIRDWIRNDHPGGTPNG